MKELLKKYQLHIIATLVLVVAGIVVYSAIKQSSVPISNSPTHVTDSEASPTPTPPLLKPAPSPAPAPVAQSTTLRLTSKALPGKNYQEVVEIYKDRRFQFDATCKSTPNSLTFKNGPEVMFDNRTATEKIIKLNNIGYKIGPYGFIVLTITAPSVPYTVEIDCDQLFNTAIIKLQQ